MKIALFTNEFPPNIYGGAGVHIDFLSQPFEFFYWLKLTYKINVKCNILLRLSQKSLVCKSITNT